MKPNFFDYDIIHLGVSGGKDSTAALLWLVHESNIPLSRVRVTFCDTGNEDVLTYNFLALLSETVHPIEIIYPKRDFWELALWKKRFPSRKARFCTQYLKVEPSRDYIWDFQQQSLNVLLLNGVRSDESHSSNDRGEVPKFGWDEGFACNIYRPLLDYSLDDVWEMHKRYLNIDDVLWIIDIDPLLSDEHKKVISDKMSLHGIPRNPLYDMGAVRVGCFPCINSRKLELRAMATYRPERVGFIASKEQSFNNANMYSTMFARNTVPEVQRSKEIITKKGERMKVATIYDVVRWSKTSHGGKQQTIELPDTYQTACDIGGMCE